MSSTTITSVAFEIQNMFYGTSFITIYHCFRLLSHTQAHYLCRKAETHTQEHQYSLMCQPLGPNVLVEIFNHVNSIKHGRNFLKISNTFP